MPRRERQTRRTRRARPARHCRRERDERKRDDAGERHPCRVEPRGRGGEAREAAVDQRIDDPAPPEPRPFFAARVGEAAQRESRGGLFEHGLTAGRVRGAGQGDEPAPARAAGFDRHDRAPVVVGGGGGLARAAPPSAQRLRLDRAADVRDDHLVRDRFEHDGCREGEPDLLDDELGRRPAQCEAREERPHGVARFEGRGLVGDDAAVHGFGDRDELDLAVQRDQGDPRRAGGLGEHGGHVAIVRTELEHDARRPDLRQLRDESREAGGVVGPA